MRDLKKIKKDFRLQYPNPQFIRKNWLDLCGEWNFAFDDKNIGEKEKWYQVNKQFNTKINVPYCVQSKLSGIGDIGEHNIVWYKKNIDIKINENKKYILNFEAVDYFTKVYINGELVGSNKGGFTPFSADITDYMNSENNQITLRVEDYNSCTQPIGKQSWRNENFICWYTRTTGIWQPVWLETVDKLYIEKFKILPDLSSSSVNIDVYVNGFNTNSFIEAEITYNGEFINKATGYVKNNRMQLKMDVSSEVPHLRLNYWTPDTPYLYDIKFTLRSDNYIDEIYSYFGMRNISVKDSSILLNEQFFYQKLILDQGYFDEGLMTHRNIEDLIGDILKIKEMGFNGARKHQKVENHKYLYLCDSLGLVLWAEMPSGYEYSDKSIYNHFNEISGLVNKHYNHPSVIAYTVMNESWGVNEIHTNKDQQNFVNALYYSTKALDSSRLIIGNDGWEQTCTDILTIHDYNSNHETLSEQFKDKEKAVNGTPSLTALRQSYCKGYKYNNIPIIISEYGGIAFGHSDSKDNWGYGNRPKSKEEVIKRFDELTSAIMNIDYVCGFCYTQLTDVEQEINGLLDKNHNYKFPPEKIREILNRKHMNGFVME